MTGATEAFRRQAHQSGDGVTIRHCPFCGSGQVIGRSDGDVECGFCNQAFLVRVQPMFSAFPQSVGGMPVQIPGMPPPQSGMPGMPGQMPPGAGGEDGEEDQDGAPPFGGGDEDPSVSSGGSAASGPPQFGGGEGGKGSSDSGSDKDSKDSGPPKKQSFHTAQGSQVGYDAYLAYLAGKVTS